MTGSGCGFNRSMQHLDSHRRAEEVAYEVPDEDPVHRGRQSLDVGALATGRVAARDRSAIRSLPCFDWRHPVENRRYTSLATASLSVGAGVVRARRALPRGDGRTVDAYDGARTGTGRARRTPRRGNGPVGRSAVNWHRTG